MFYFSDPSSQRHDKLWGEIFRSVEFRMAMKLGTICPVWVFFFVEDA